MTLFEDAIVFATTAHSGVLRRYTNEPYILHPLRVAMRIAAQTTDEEERAAAVLHDTMEDVDWVTQEVIADNFTPRVAELVYWLLAIKYNSLFLPSSVILKYLPLCHVLPI